MHNTLSKRKTTFLLFFIPILIIIFIGLSLTYFIKFKLLPSIRHENLLETAEILCLTLDVHHGCDTENYTDEELKKYLKEDVLTKISLEEAEQIVLGEKELIPEEYRGTTKEEAERELRERNREHCKERGGNYYKWNEDKCYVDENGYYEVSSYGTPNSFPTRTREDYYLNRILALLQQIK